MLPAGCLTQDAIVSIYDCSLGSEGQDGLVRIGPAYNVSLSTGQAQLNAPAYLHMRFGTTRVPVNVASVTIARWDEGRQIWAPLTTNVDPKLMLAYAQVDHLSVFAVLAQPSGPQEERLYLPLLVR